MKAKPWQTTALTNLKALFSDGPHGLRHRAALLQLPTGLGKSLLATRLFQSLAKRYPGLHLLIALPKKTHLVPDGWRSAITDKLDVTPSWSPASCPKLKRSRLAFTTHHLLSKPTGELKTWLASRRLLLVVDECHSRHSLGRIAAVAAESFFESADAEGLPKWLKRPGPGRPPLGPFVLLVSATPYNPVRLDFLDQVEDGTSADVDEREAESLLDELRITQGFLGQCDRSHERSMAVERYMLDVGDVLRGHSDASPRSPLAVVPRITDNLGPRRPPDHAVKVPKADAADAIGQVAAVHAALRSVKSCNRTVVERLALAGVQCSPGSHNVLGLRSYSKLTRNGLKEISKARVDVTLKLESLSALIESIRAARRKVVVFCTFEASARSAVNYLRQRLGPQETVHDSTRDSDGAIEAFNTLGQGPGVLVATDRLSESIDLHHDPAARFLVHFELPWSPLRLLQRFGRLWRIPRKHTSSARLPVAPHVFHVVHPSSVEEEILHRLHRRWSYLRGLGLGSVPLKVGLGERVPRVPDGWQ